MLDLAGQDAGDAGERFAEVHAFFIDLCQVENFVDEGQEIGARGVDGLRGFELLFRLRC